MKKQLLVLFLGAVFTFPAFAQDNQSPVNVKGSGSAMQAGFNSWGQSELTTGSTGGEVLASEVKAWDQTYNNINR